MDSDPTPDRLDSPAAMLDMLRAHPEWSDRERDDLLGRLVERFPSGRVVEAVRARLHDLRGGDAEAMFRLIEAHPEPGLLRELAEALESQPDLRPETAWDALAVLDAAGALELSPALAERYDELNDLLEDGDSIDELVEQIEGDPEGIGQALQGLGAVEPEARPEIIAGLGDGALGPGLVEFLRLLAYAHEPRTRAAALDVLLSGGVEEPVLVDAWMDLAARHPDPAVVAEASKRVRASHRELTRPAPRIVRSLVTAVDGRGRGSIVLGAEGGRGRVTAAFVCDVEHGVLEVQGDVAGDAGEALAAFEEFSGRVVRESVENAHELALSLLAGSLLLSGPGAPPALRYWVEATVGRDFRPAPFRSEFPGWGPASVAFTETTARSNALLDACPDWVDTSPLTFEMAEEIHLREDQSPPQPGRDAGAYRVLFERRLRGQLERYRLMLLWMAWCWRASGRDDLAVSAWTLTWQLSDAQHAVPGHPFTVALTTRSLAAAQEALLRGKVARPWDESENGRPAR